MTNRDPDSALRDFVVALRRRKRCDWLIYPGGGVILAWLAARDGVAFVPRGSDLTYSANTVDSLASPALMAVGVLMILGGIVLKVRLTRRMKRSAAAVGTDIGTLRRTLTGRS